MPIEASYAPQTSGGGPPFRVVQMQTIINGVPTTVDVEGIVLVDGDGRIVFKPGDSDQLLNAILTELRALRQQIAPMFGFPTGLDSLPGV